MAQNESDREDLMSEAVSLIKRIECRQDSRPDPLVLGLNALGWLFVYPAAELMYRFDERGRLRRAFVEGMLYRSAGTVLSMLQRQRTHEQTGAITVTKTTLLRRDLTPPELNSFRLRMSQELTAVRAAVDPHRVLRQYPADEAGVLAEIQLRLLGVVETEEFLAPAFVRRS